MGARTIAPTVALLGSGTLYATLLSRAEDLLQDQSESLTTDARADAFREALVKYSRDIPREIIEDFTGDGTAYRFAFDGPFSIGFSQVRRVELPVGRRPARYLSHEQYGLYQSGTETVELDLPFVTPGASESLRVTYTARHTINGFDNAGVTTVPAWHETALVMLAASRMLARLAGRFIHEQDSTIDADATNRNSKDESAAKRSRALETDYHNLLGIRRGTTPGVVVGTWGTGGILTFPGRRRT